MKFAKLLSVVLFAMMLISSVSFGQAIPSGTARYEALGYNPFIKDASIDINRNPAWSTEYRNYAFGDIGRTEVGGEGGDQYQLTDQFGAVNFGVSKEIALGLVVNKFEDNWNDFYSYSNTMYGIERPVVPLKILFGWQTSPNFSIGLAPYFAMWSQEYDTTGINRQWSSSSLGGQVGVIGKLNKADWIEGAVDVKSNGYKLDRTEGGTNTVNENEGGLELDVYTRAFFTINKSLGINLVPYLNFSMYGWNPTSTPLDSNGYNDYSHMSIMGGIGINMPVLDQGLLAGGLTFGYRSFENTQDVANVTDKYTEFILPQFNLGMEWPFTDWLTGRLGYSRAVSSTNNEFTTSAGTRTNKGTAVSTPDQTITAGLGFNF